MDITRQKNGVCDGNIAFVSSISRLILEPRQNDDKTTETNSRSTHFKDAIFETKDTIFEVRDAIFEIRDPIFEVRETVL